MTLFAQDWGGPIGLAQAAETPERFERLMIMNTWLPHDGYAYSPAIRGWAAAWGPDGIYATALPGNLKLGSVMATALGYIDPPTLFAMAQGGTMPKLAPEAVAVIQGYDAPHAGLGPDAYAGPRRFPLSIPIDRPDDQTARDGARHFEALKSWLKPIHFIWGGKDGVFTETWGREWAAFYPQATFDLLADAGHFPQETHGERIADLLLGYAKGGAG